MPAVAAPPLADRAAVLQEQVGRIAALVRDAVGDGRLALGVGREALGRLREVARDVDAVARTGAAEAAVADVELEAPVQDVDAQTDAEADDAPAAGDGEAAAPPEPEAAKKGRAKKRKPSARGVVEIPLAELRTDPARFQPRGAAFSEDSARRVAEEFDANLFEPVVVWEDPADGHPYVLAGHSRYEGFLRRQKADPDVTTIPARHFEGDEAAAKRFAATENDKGTALANHERASYLREMREGGAAVADVEKEAKRLYKRDAATVLALSYLDPSGPALDALRALPAGTDDARDAETMAVWVGKTRRAHPPSPTPTSASCGPRSAGTTRRRGGRSRSLTRSARCGSCWSRTIPTRRRALS